MIVAICDKCGNETKNKVLIKKVSVSMLPLWLFERASPPDHTLDICDRCYNELIKKTAPYDSLRGSHPIGDNPQA